MTKTLRVIDSFFCMEVGDIFEFDEQTNSYISRHNEEFYKTKDDSISEVKAVYDSQFQLSKGYAKALIEDGYLEEVNEDAKTNFVNIFDEIDNLIAKYKDGLSTLEKDTVGVPNCVKVERETVLTNLITLLEHLKSLKK